jgi:hypothetical protein
MVATSTLSAVATVQLDSVLADAVVLNWSDLMPALTSGLIHIEYHVGPRGAVEFLKVWAAPTRGQWDLVCEHFLLPSTASKRGLRFANGYKSEGLETMLGSIMQHQEIFLVSTAPGADRMIQVPPPTATDRLAASSMMDALRERLAS